MSQTKKVLIVEDRPEIRKLLTMVMSSAPCEIHEAEDGESGLMLARALRPDLMLLDVMMPGRLDGFAVCRVIKSTPGLAGIKVVMVTAMAQEGDRARGAEAGADDYLIKPFTVSGLRQVVQKWLGQ